MQVHARTLSLLTPAYARVPVLNHSVHFPVALAVCMFIINYRHCLVVFDTLLVFSCFVSETKLMFRFISFLEQCYICDHVPDSEQCSSTSVCQPGEVLSLFYSFSHSSFLSYSVPLSHASIFVSLSSSMKGSVLFLVSLSVTLYLSSTNAM